jgi:AraC-like DNA-binding protein/CheY-like chemotaxis protein
MIVEDEMLVRVGLRNLIDWGKLGIAVRGDASDGVEALELYRRLKPDLIITDIRMPRMDGLDLVRRIRQTDRRVRVVILTCLEELDLARKAMELGVDGYILKLTMTPQEMEAVLLRALERLGDWGPMSPAPPASEGTPDARADRDRRLRSYFVEHTCTRDELEAALAPLGPDGTPAGLIVARMAVEQSHAHDRPRAEGAGGIHSSVADVADGIARKYQDVHVACLRDDDYLVIYTPRSATVPARQREHLDAMLRNLGNTLRRYFGLTVSLGVSATVDGLAAMDEAYRQASVALDHRVYAGKSSITWFDAAALASLARQRLGLLAEGPRELRVLECEAEYRRRVAGLMDRAPDSAEALRDFYVHLLQMAALSPAMDRMPFEDLVIRYTATVRACQTLDEMDSVFRSFLRDALTTARSALPETQSIAKALHHIKTHYADDLSLNAIAHVAGLSPNYFSALFRKELGTGFLEYLVGLRIERAKELLRGTRLLSYQIADKVGFADPAHFSRTFKKYMGLSPNAFRKRWKAG